MVQSPFGDVSGEGPCSSPHPVGASNCWGPARMGPRAVPRGFWGSVPPAEGGRSLVASAGTLAACEPTGGEWSDQGPPSA